MKILLRRSQHSDIPFLREMLYEAVFWRAGEDTPLFEEGLATVVPAEPGVVMVQDSILMPIGAFILFLGVLALIVALIWCLVDFVRNRLRKN